MIEKKKGKTVANEPSYNLNWELKNLSEIRGGANDGPQGFVTQPVNFEVALKPNARSST